MAAHTRRGKRSTIVPVFVDTNVLVYARDLGAGDKQPRAEAWISHLWRTDEGRISTQVLQEFYAVVTRKLRQPAEETRTEIRDLMAWGPIAIDLAALEAAWSLEERFHLSFWDSLIVAAARITRSDTLLTEDLQHGADFDGVVVVNPFRTGPEDS